MVKVGKRGIPMKSPSKRGRTLSEYAEPSTPIAAKSRSKSITSGTKFLSPHPGPPDCKDDDGTFFSPHKRRKYDFYERRRKLSMDEDTDPWFLIKFLRETIGHQPYEGKPMLPPKNDDLPTLVLDLDETLVHCCTNPLPDPDLVFNVEFSGVTYNVNAKLRPGMYDFLREMAQEYELVIFTASQSAYANKILDIIDTEGLISHRLFRENCTNVCGNYIKDLKCLGRDLKKTIIVDNSPQVFAFQIYNGVPITSWYDNKEDDELMRLTALLMEIRNEPDLRVNLNKEFELEKMLDNLDERVYFQFIGDYID